MGDTTNEKVTYILWTYGYSNCSFLHQTVNFLFLLVVHLIQQLNYGMQKYIKMLPQPDFPPEILTINRGYYKNIVQMVVKFLSMSRNKKRK